MKKPNSTRWLMLIIMLFLTPSFIGFSQNNKQNRNDLEKERDRLEKEIDLTKKLISETRSTRKKSINEISLLKRQITLRENVVKNLAREVEQLETDINDLQAITGSIQKDITKFQTEYAQIAYITYKSQNKISTLLWLMSSENFTQAYNRLLYFREFSNYRKEQIFLLKRTQNYLTEKAAELQQKRIKKAQLAGIRIEESNKLADSHKEKNELISQLLKQETDYRNQVREFKANIRKISAAIDKAIADEVARARAEQEKNVEKTEIAVISSNNFEKNQGKIPWPLPSSKGVITGNFGQMEDPSGGVIDNHGVYISTSEGQEVRAVFQGKVTGIRNVPEFGKVVIIRHGKYMSVYANLQNLQIKEGDEVEALQPIGTVRTSSKGDSQLHFLVYREKTPINPSEWLAPK